VVLGLNGFEQTKRLNIDRYTNGFMEHHRGFIKNYWPMYAVC
jgi:hypothetical protein